MSRMGDALPYQGDGVGQIRETEHLLFPSLPTKKTAEPNLIVLVVLWLLLGSERGQWGDG